MNTLVKIAATSALTHQQTDYEINAEYAFNKQQTLQFLNGLVEGSLEENHLKYLETCYEDGKFASKEMTTIVKDFAKHDLKDAMDAVEHLGNIFIHMPKIFVDCIRIKSELARLEHWAQPFLKPKEEMPKIWANLMKSYPAMIHDLDITDQKWIHGDITGAGKEAAQILKLGLGPVPKRAEESVKIDKADVAKFLNGLVLGSLEENHLKEIEHCYTDGEEVEAKMVQIVKDFKFRDLDHIMQAVGELGSMFVNMPKYLGDCEKIKPEVARLEKWAAPFKNQPKEEMQHVWTNILSNYAEMIHDLDITDQIIAKHDVQGAGKEAAKILELGLGPVPEAEPLKPYTSFDKKSVQKFMNGLILGSLEENHLSEIEKCFVDTESVGVEMLAIVQDIKEKSLDHIMDAIQRLGGIFMKSPKYLNDCSHMKAEVLRLKHWVAPLKNHPKEEMPKIWANVLSNYAEMIHDLDITDQIIAKHNIQGAGKEAAKILQLALGPVPKTFEPETIEFTQW